jgi:copper chaperone CopZ|tara:strand:+ start:147 stop:530 length:384 start_codon:yes stop_codon:yes gene_type:complete
MAVQQITHKKIIKYDTNSPNFKAAPKEEKVVSGNVQEDTDVYGERKHTYIPDPNGNLKMEELMGKVINKLDNIPGGSQTGTKAVEVDIKREIAIGKVDASAVKSEEIKGKVNNKLDKLKKLRRRNGN